MFLSVKEHYGEQRPYDEETGAFSPPLRWCEALRKAELDPGATLCIRPKVPAEGVAQADFL